MNLLKRLVVEEEGQGLVEYALILGLIALVVVGALTLAGQSVESIWDKITGELDKVPGTGEED